MPALVEPTTIHYTTNTTILTILISGFNIGYVRSKR